MTTRLADTQHKTTEAGIEALGCSVSWSRSQSMRWS